MRFAWLILPQIRPACFFSLKKRALAEFFAGGGFLNDGGQVSAVKLTFW